jgi:uncharacterized membrane protein YtjA (UPF0391 family)
MLYWALMFLIIALIAGFLGFGGIAFAAAGIAKILFFIFLVVFVVMLITGLMGRRSPPMVPTKARDVTRCRAHALRNRIISNSNGKSRASRLCLSIRFGFAPCNNLR